MRTKNAARITAAEAAHMAKVKMAGCVICNAGPPNEAHHPRQGLHFCTIAVCTDCHTGTGGWHRNKTMWRIAKMDELSALNETLRRVEQMR